MIQEVYISDMSQVQDMLVEQEYDPKIHRDRSPYLYRGMPNVDYVLKTSLQRNCREQGTELERSILRNFSKYAVLEDPQIQNSVWRQLVLGQQHGLPTRLLDWTYSPLVGLHFATSGINLDKMESHDAVIWRMNINEINAGLPPAYQERMQREKASLFTIDMLRELTESLQQYDEDMAGYDSMVLLEPPSIDQRIINQSSYFAVVPRGVDDIAKFLEKEQFHVIKYVIDKKLKWRIRDMLDQLNISERIMYPGLDGLAMWLTRHYYVK